MSYFFQQNEISWIRRTIVQHCDYNPDNNLISFEAGFHFSTKRMDWSYNTDLVQLASAILTDIINQNISKVTRIAKPNDTGAIIYRTYNFSSLFEIAYWQLLDTLEGGEIRKCEECDAPFIVTNRRQKFCPKLEFQSASNCALLFRQKKHLEKFEEKET